MIRIAQIDNVSALAFRLAPPTFPTSILDASPTGVYDALSEGRCDAALLPVACLPGLSATVESIGAYGIACEGAVHSVALYAKYPLHRLLSERRPIYVTEKSQTSRRLLQYLCQRDYGCLPSLVSTPVSADACLWIGEDALDYLRDTARWPIRYDMSQWWFERMALPFVFARWVVRRDLDREHKDAIASWLESTTRVAATPGGRERLASVAGARMPSRAFALMYYERIRPRLTLRDLQGLNTFLAGSREERWNITA